MILSIEHDLLITGSDLESCCQNVMRFFDKSQLVHYDSVEIDQQLSLNALSQEFEHSLNQALQSNHEILADLLGTLKVEGCTKMEDLLHLPQGVQSKILHTMCHLLDGFFGVDSRFYDIDEMSHWITKNRQRKIQESPEQCWLVHAKAKSFYGGGFEKRSR